MPDATPMYLYRSAHISTGGLYRWSLTRIWDSGRPLMVWVMLNPSTADGSVDDPTIRRCIGFARAWGYGGIVVVNLYALRSSDPKALWAHPDPVGPRNDAYLRRIARDPRFRLVMLAWGANAPGAREAQAMRILTDCYAHGGQLAVLGWTRDNHPRHPLYVRADTQPQPAAVPALTEQEAPA